MKRTDQKKFVRSLCNSVRDTILKEIDDDRIPDEWDGHEFRELIGEHFEREAKNTMIRIFPRSRRTKDYRATVYGHNL